MAYIKQETLVDAAHEIIDLALQYPENNRSERKIDPLIFGLFYCWFNVRRQAKVSLGRIDFRQRYTNYAYIEVAVRASVRSGCLVGSQNRSEIHKLERQQVAKGRYLLLLDLAKHPVNVDKLWDSYDDVRSGRGHYKRHSVRIVYVHRNRVHDSDYLWQP